MCYFFITFAQLSRIGGNQFLRFNVYVIEDDSLQDRRIFVL